MFKNNLQQLFYKFLVLLFYYIGDILCRCNFQWSANLYQKAMNSSVYYDEKINFWWWKEPTLNTKTFYENFN